MERLKLQVEAREGTGKGPNRRLRAAARVPAVLYGRDTDPVALSCDRQEFDKMLAKGVNALIDLHGTKDVEGKIVLVREVQRDPVKRTPLHCDLYAIDLNRQIEVEVPIHLVGKCHGVEMGGVLEPLMREIEVRCLPMAIPDSFEVDVTNLDIGDTVHTTALTFPEGVEPVDDEERPVVHVIEARLAVVDEEPAEGEAVEGEAPAEGETPAAESAEESSGD